MTKRVMPNLSVRELRVGALIWGALTWSAVGFAVFQLFRGEGQHHWWALLAVAVPTLRVAILSDYRQLIRTRFAEWWACCQTFHTRSGPIPWQGTFTFVVLPFAFLFLMNSKVQVGDNAPVFLAASSLVREGNLECSEFVEIAEWSNLGNQQALNVGLRHTSRGIYSNYPVGPLQVAIPVAMVSRLVGADLDRIKVHERLQKFSAACLSAVCLGLFFLVAVCLAPPESAWVATLLLALGSAMYSTIAVGIWQHGGIIFWSLVFVLTEYRQSQSSSWKWTLLQGVALGSMIPWRPSSLLVAGSLGLWTLCRKPKQAVLVALVAALAFLPWGMFYWTCYENLLGPTHTQSEQGNWHWTSIDGFLGVLISPGRGFIVYQPWIVLVGLWLLPAVRASHSAVPLSMNRQSILPFCALAVILNFTLVGAWCMWWGGWCYGSRLNSEVLPLAALLCLRPITYLWVSLHGRKLIIGLLFFAFLIHASCVYCGADRWDGVPNDIDHHPERLWRWDDPPFLYPLLKNISGRGAA